VRAEYARRYRDLWQGHWWWRARAAWLLGRVGRLARRDGRLRILDVGCGDGLFFDDLARFGDVDGLEPDAALLSNGPWRGRITVAPLDARFRPEEPYDLALMLDVLEHIEDDAGALRAVHDALRPGGRLLLTVPALPWLWSRHDEANQHYRRYEPRGLRERLGRAGFVVESLRFFFAWTVAPLLLRRLLAPAGRDQGIANDEVAIPPAPVNRALEALSRLDLALGRVVPWPLGSSLIAVGRRAEEGDSPQRPRRTRRKQRIMN
jgi:SAM-dependent methyltransferase